MLVISNKQMKKNQQIFLITQNGNSSNSTAKGKKMPAHLT